LFAAVVLADPVPDLLADPLALAPAGPVSSPKLDVFVTVVGLPLTTDVVVDVDAVFGEGGRS
jgi:hypothetical protein